MLISITLITIIFFLIIDLNTFFSIIEYKCNAEKTINPYQSIHINYSIEYDNGLD